VTAITNEESVQAVKRLAFIGAHSNSSTLPVPDEQSVLTCNIRVTNLFTGAHRAIRNKADNESVFIPTSVTSGSSIPSSRQTPSQMLCTYCFNLEHLSSFGNSIKGCNNDNNNIKASQVVCQCTVLVDTASSAFLRFRNMPGHSNKIQPALPS